MKRALLIGVVGVFACGGNAPTQPQGPVARPPVTPPVEGPKMPVQPPVEPALALWPEVKRGQLPNGLTYYILKNKKPDKRALLWLAVNSGSVQEDDDQRGLAHFVEHMQFNGTKRFPKNEIINAIESMGMRFGADLNAYTSWDETVYQLEVPTDKDLMDKGFDILRDWSGEATFDQKEVDLERGVVLEEWRLGLGANRRLFDKHVKVLFKGSRYADRITIGLADTIKNAPRDALVRYYKDWYRPDQMAVIVVGDFDDAAAIEKQITAKFGDLKAPAKPRPRVKGAVPTAGGTRISIETDHEQTTQSISVDNLLAARQETTEKDFRRQLTEQLYRGIFNERMRNLARKKDAPFMGASGGFGGETREIDSFSRSATIKNGRTEDAFRALFVEVLRVEQHGFTQGELDRARTNVMRGFDQGVSDAPTARSRPRAAELVRNFFTKEFIVGPQAERDLAAKLLPGITLAELDQLAKTSGGAENRVILYSGPDDKPVPSQDKLRAIIDEVGKSKLDPWVDKAPPTQLMTTTPTPGKVTAETKNDKLGVTEWKLSNGARVIVRPSDFEADSIMLAATSPGGTNLATPAQYNDARFADNIAALGGVAEFDTEDLGKILTGKQASAGTSINEITDSMRGNASAKDLETMFQLLYLRVTAPRKDEDQFGVWKGNYIERLKNQEKSPDFQYANKSSDVLWQNNPRRKTPTVAEIEKVDQDKALAFYKDRFADVSDFTFVIVGTIDLAKLKPLVETYLASMPGKGRKDKEKDIGIRRVGGVVKKAWEFGQADKARVSILFHGDETWSRDKERDMYVLGRVLSIKLREKLREDLGGVYGVSAGGSITRTPRQERVFSIGFGADPKRVDELIAAAYKVVDDVTKNGVEEKDLDKLRKGYEREREIQLKTNSFWLGWLESAARFGDDPNLILDPAPMLARMTNANVKASVKRYLDRGKVYTSIMMPGGPNAPKPDVPQNQPKTPKKQPPKADKDPKMVPGAEKP